MPDDVADRDQQDAYRRDLENTLDAKAELDRPMKLIEVGIVALVVALLIVLLATWVALLSYGVMKAQEWL